MTPSDVLIRVADPRRWQPAWVRDICIGIALFLVAAAAAGTFAARSRVMPAGDTFNFIVMADFLAQGTFPSDEKRLPLYSVLILLGRTFSDDPVAVARTISVLAYMLTPVVLYAIGRRLKLASLPFALLLFVGLVHPVLLGNGIRELADTTFLFLLSLANFCAVSVRKTRAWVVITGVIFAALALTRYESMLALVVLLPLLRLRVPWRTVLAIGGVTILCMSPWLVLATKTFGKLWNPTYFRCLEDCGYGTRLRDMPSRVYSLLDITGWTTLWKHPAALQKDVREDPQQAVLPRLVKASSWWVSLFAVFGVLRLLLRRTRTALLFRSGGTQDEGVRFAILYCAMRKSTALTLALLVLLVREEFSGLYAGAVGRVFSYQGNGYALYQATWALARESGDVVLRKDYPMALAVFRLPSLTNFRAIFLEFGYPNTDPQQIAVSLADRRPVWVIVDDSELMKQLADVLRLRGVVTEERVYAARHGLNGETEERTVVLRLDWDRQKQ
ncbi:MAG: hypothetical protein G01um101438_541 [Parcubacteria group bacterium Gr01-1014_38]|nr:MAG: hypothetical protein G01um101438_541 [Parcubacteria group bacterium Gr01-1014_38]